MEADKVELLAKNRELEERIRSLAAELEHADAGVGGQGPGPRASVRVSQSIADIHHLQRRRMERLQYAGAIGEERKEALHNVDVIRELKGQLAEAEIQVKEAKRSLQEREYAHDALQARPILLSLRSLTATPLYLPCLMYLSSPVPLLSRSPLITLATCRWSMRILWLRWHVSASCGSPVMRQWQLWSAAKPVAQTRQCSRYVLLGCKHVLSKSVQYLPSLTTHIDAAARSVRWPSSTLKCFSAGWRTVMRK